MLPKVLAAGQFTSGSSISSRALSLRAPQDGSHIYIRPSGEHRFTTLDDLSETSLARLSADSFNPCAVVETSVGNFQVWLKHPQNVSEAPRNLCRADIGR